MLIFFLTAFYFCLPAIVANIAPALFRHCWEFLAEPIDGNWLWRNKPILGKHKTWRGLIVGVAASIIVVLLQKMLFNYSNFRLISYINYYDENFIVVGFLFGFGALAGDAVKSLIKRRLNFKAGDSFFPWDQIDFVVGASLLISLIKPLTLSMWIVYIIGALILNPLTNRLAFKFGLKDVPW